MRWSCAPLAALCLAIAPALAQAQESAHIPAALPSVTAAEQSGFFHEPSIIGRGLGLANRISTSGDGGEIKNGFYPELGEMISGAGWISVGPGYRHWFRQDHVFVDTSAALSWRLYKVAQARVELPGLARSRITAGTQVRWQDLTQVTYFGTGPDSLEANRSEYRLKSTNLVGYIVGKPTRWLSMTGKAGVLAGISLAPPAGAFPRGHPDAATVFPDEPVFQLAEQPDFIYGEVSVRADTRDERGYPSEGGFYQALFARYADRGTEMFGFQRYEAEGAQFFPIASHRIVAIAHGWFAGSRADAGQAVPLYLLPSLGGSNSLRGYTTYRFHDRNLLLLKAELRVKLFTHIDWAAFAEAGNVAPAVSDLDLDRRSYGIGFRVHTERATIARIRCGARRRGLARDVPGHRSVPLVANRQADGAAAIRAVIGWEL
jgi:hypothetical protein